MDKIAVKKILDEGTPQEVRALFAFTKDTKPEVILQKFNIWTRYFFPKYHESKDAPFHKDINSGNIAVYLGILDGFVDIAFRGAGKDVKTKLLIAFVILNDESVSRRFFKILAADGANSTQTVTDIYNLLVSPRIKALYPATFAKTDLKREETKGSFVTANAIKVAAGTVGTDQRGDVVEDARPDFIWYNDFENRTTLRSRVTTKTIWDNMEEARTGLQKGGGCVYTCNYISEQGNVHKLVTEKKSPRKLVLIVPIEENGASTWDRYTKEDIEQMRLTDDDFEGERMCRPSASKEVLFDRERLDAMVVKQPIKNSAGFKIYRLFDPSHRYGSGHDVAGGVELDSSTSVFIDFDLIPAEVVATFYSNTIKPEAFGDEVYREQEMFGGCIAAIENNKFDQAILKAKLLDANLYRQESKDAQIYSGTPKDYGWNTNSLTKSKAILALEKAISDGLLLLNDPDLIAEAKSYTRNDLIDKEPDIRLATRHFDLLMAASIAWQMLPHARVVDPLEEVFDEDQPLYPSIGL